jgi:hypothetical protein
MSEKQFHISDVLSVSTGALVSTRRMDGVYDIMGHIVDDDGISTIGIAAMRDTAKKFLEEKLPWVKEVKFPKMAEGLTNEERTEFVDRFVKEAAAKYGEYQDIGQMTQKPDVSMEAELNYIDKVKGRAPATTKTYARFSYPGILFAESEVSEVTSRDVKAIEVPESAFSVQFFDRSQTEVD